MALINLILAKYNEYLQDEDYKRFGSFHLQTNQEIAKNSVKPLTTRAGSRAVTSSVRTQNFSPSGNNAQQRKDEECSELSSLSSTSSSSSSSSTSSFSSSSSSTADSISSTSSQPSSELSGQSQKPLFNTVYDGSLGLYLSEKSEESVGDNWTLKPEQNFFLFNSIFGLQRLSMRGSLNSYLTNLTDDLKSEVDAEMKYSNEETDCEYTEKLFQSGLRYRSPQPNVVYERQRFYLRLGDEIGESSTDDVGDDDNILPVFERVQMLESLTNEKNPQLSKVQHYHFKS